MYEDALCGKCNKSCMSEAFQRQRKGERHTDSTGKANVTQPFYMDETLLPAGQMKNFICKKYIPGSVSKGIPAVLTA